jgi:hypothetical protein
VVLLKTELASTGVGLTVVQPFVVVVWEELCLRGSPCQQLLSSPMNYCVAAPSWRVVHEVESSLLLVCRVVMANLLLLVVRREMNSLNLPLQTSFRKKIEGERGRKSVFEERSWLAFIN